MSARTSRISRVRRAHAASRRAVGAAGRCDARAARRCDARAAGRRDARVARGGFTLVEILVALGILLFGMAAVLGLLTFGAAMSRTALLRTSAASAAEAVASDLEETLFPMIEGEAGAPVDVVDRAISGQSEIVYSARAVENPDRPLEYRVDVEMSWSSAGVRREKRFRTLLVREIPFGERLRRRFVEGGSTAGEETKPVVPPAASAGAKATGATPARDPQ